MPGPPAVDVIDETFLAVPPKIVASCFTDPAVWPELWPDLVLDIYADRGDAGLRWTVRGGLIGTMEVWLEPVMDGTVLHYFLRADLPGVPAGTPGRSARLQRRERHRRQQHAKRIALRLKRTLEEGRPPGEPPAPV